MLSTQLKHAFKRAVRNSPIAPALRALRAERPLDASIRDGHKYGWRQAADDFLIGSMLDHVALLRGLREDINRSCEAELLLTEVRRHVLLNPAMMFRSSVPDFVAALIQQCANNEYVWYVSDVEQHTLQQPPKYWYETAAHAMYRPIHELSGATEGMPQVLCSVIDAHLAAYDEEMRIKEGIPTFAPIEDPTSRKIREMYECYPYPRWIQLNRSTPGKRERWMREFLTPAPLKFLDGEFSILMPGCGTGRKAIQLALAFPRAKVLCTDLSRSSLAYLMRMANRLGAWNIEPLQMDIYDLARFDRQFDYIDTTGVLHHLGDPVRGGRACVSRLKPGGVMHFSMYSELARREVVRHRQRYEERIPSMTTDDIRAYRRKVMLEEQGCVDKLPTPGDFFDLSRCKDLIMHPNEYRYTVPQIGTYLQQIGLPFYGFQRPPLNRHAYWTNYPNKSQQRDLNAWREFEEANPDAFEDLYDVWTVKPES